MLLHHTSAQVWKNKPSGFWQSRDFKYCVNTEREYIYISLNSCCLQPSIPLPTSTWRSSNKVTNIPSPSQLTGSPSFRHVLSDNRQCDVICTSSSHPQLSSLSSSPSFSRDTPTPGSGPSLEAGESGFQHVSEITRVNPSLFLSINFIGSST